MTEVSSSAMRKYSIDSQSSGTSNDTQSQRKSKLVIKKKLLKPKQPPFMILSGQYDNTPGTFNSYLQNQSTSLPLSKPLDKNLNANNSYMSFTDQSDSDYSAFENHSLIEGIGGLQTTGETKKDPGSIKHHALPKNSLNSSILSGRASVGGTPSTVGNRVIFDVDANNMAQHSVEHKKIFHPFAEKPSPFEEWKQAILLALETIFQFFTMDIIGNSLYYLWKCIEYIVLTPVAFLGLLFEYLRALITKCMKSSGQRFPFRRSKQSFFEGDHSRTKEKGDLIIVLDLDMTLVYSSPFQPEPTETGYVKVQTDSLDVFVYKRPYLDQFLKDIADLGQVYVFTASKKSYADPIIDEIDPKGIIKGRFYREDCKLDKHGNHIKPIDVITKNKKKLLIIDDSEFTYNLYKENTILVEAWTNQKKKDKWLLECLNILEQIRISNSKDIRQDLQNIIDIHHHYK